MFGYKLQEMGLKNFGAVAVGILKAVMMEAYIGTLAVLDAEGGGDSSVVRAPDS